MAESKISCAYLSSCSFTVLEVVVSTPGSYSGYPGLKRRGGDPLSRLNVSWFYSFSPVTCGTVNLIGLRSFSLASSPIHYSWTIPTFDAI